MMKQSFASLLGLTLLSSCGTIAGWKQSMMGTEPENRAPASTGSSGGVSFADNRSVPGAYNNPAGPNLYQNEFARQTGYWDERAARGNRRNADPWDGTGPTNEGSLWNPQGQDGFYFSRNSHRKMGDLLVVKVERDINDALNARIASILGRTGLRQVVADETGREVASEVAKKVTRAVGNDAVGTAVGAEMGNRATAALDKDVRYLDVDEVSVRITDVLKGNIYRIDGTKRVVIKGAPYTLRLQGQVRDEDVATVAMVSSNQVFESRMDLIK